MKSKKKKNNYVLSRFSNTFSPWYNANFFQNNMEISLGHYSITYIILLSSRYCQYCSSPRVSNSERRPREEFYAIVCFFLFLFYVCNQKFYTRWSAPRSLNALIFISSSNEFDLLRSGHFFRFLKSVSPINIKNINISPYNSENNCSSVES